MTITIYTRSAATVSWIDPVTGLPEVDKAAPKEIANRSFLTGKSGFRFVNFMEVHARHDSERNTIAGSGFAVASGIYRGPSYLGIASHIFKPIQKIRSSQESVTFSQIIGARTESPEVIGKTVGNAVLPYLGGRIGEAVAHAITGFPPIWSELEITIWKDGRTESKVISHSLFPSVTFYTPTLATSPEMGSYSRTSFNGANYYNGVPNLENWKKLGWGPRTAGSQLARGGNPWDIKK
jgi:hypothetical protein